MHQAPTSFDPQLIKGKILQYCKCLVISIENNYALVEQSFHSVLPGNEDLKYHALQPEDFIYWKRHLQEDSLQPHWEAPCQVLLTDPCTAKLQEIASWILTSHLKKAPQPKWTYSLTGYLKLKISRT